MRRFAVRMARLQAVVDELELLLSETAFVEHDGEVRERRAEQEQERRSVCRTNACSG